MKTLKQYVYQLAIITILAVFGTSGADTVKAEQQANSGNLEIAYNLLEETWINIENLEYDAAIETGNLALDMALRSLDANSLQMLEFYDVLGCSYLFKSAALMEEDGEYEAYLEQAKIFLRKVLSSMEIYYGSNHPATIKYRDSIARTFGTGFFEG